MIIFCIPLKSREVSNDWNRVTLLFNRTLESAYNQTNQNFKIFVACHQLPVLKKYYDERVTFIQVKNKIPLTAIEMMADKQTKLFACQNAARKFIIEHKLNGAYFMYVDSDDLISCNIAEYFSKNKDKTIYTSKYGYIYLEGLSYMKKARRLERACGSCYIIYLNINQLPVNDEGYLGNSIDKCPFTQEHRHLWTTLIKEQGWSHAFISFPTTIYTFGNGENWTSDAKLQLGRNRRLEYKFEIPRKISNYESEFNIKKIK